MIIKNQHTLHEMDSDSTKGKLIMCLDINHSQESTTVIRVLLVVGPFNSIMRSILGSIKSTSTCAAVTQDNVHVTVIDSEELA
ncbi:hypothetical protein KP509_29G046100 [Ceratopteris richardii]|uniref:Uncharacterized protein n=1 Tax=Ceratopteris richardii TaxID=49495 RepID=A0A8T2R7T8_CERRI|nr:hypothetical protein KP509_29G046100 [Ceratopteris richardii]